MGRMWPNKNLETSLKYENHARNCFSSPAIVSVRGLCVRPKGAQGSRRVGPALNGESVRYPAESGVERGSKVG